jgi:hypothetical protein
MPLTEAVLVYSPAGTPNEGSISLGRTSDARVLDLLRECLMAEAKRQADLWRDVDPGLAEIKEAEFQRIERVLHLVVPRPGRASLQVLRGDTAPSRRTQ